MINKIFADIDCRQINCHRDPTCGDHFIMRHLKGQRRVVSVLADGMGHGVKANMLSSLTSSIIINMMESRESLQDIARTVLNTLPVCSVRKLSYCTFTIVDVDLSTAKVDIIEYDNPQTIILRDGEPLNVEWDCHVLEVNQDQRTRRTMMTTSFDVKNGDRIVFMSDGVPQSGLGGDEYSFGWGRNNVVKYAQGMLRANTNMSAYALSSSILAKAIDIDDNKPKDDISCASIYFREPRKMLFCSCPPSEGQGVDELVHRILNYDGARVVSGYPLAEILAQKMGVSITKRLTSTDPEIPPTWSMPNVDIVSEGLLTLSKVLEILQNYERLVPAKGAAWEIVDKMLASDVIEMVIGLKSKFYLVSSSDGSDASIPTVSSVGGDDEVDLSVDCKVYDYSGDFKLRRKVIAAIAKILETKYAKYIDIIYS